ncbi:unnamed protein product [Polarella glacialis]|uniref:Uncharacterized protein n=1 Tax=Polarella glacialis TaxID=89957 RepID=A0A813JEV0_POLGL|nr:unnamed protein product [Polarella glacialis]
MELMFQADGIRLDGRLEGRDRSPCLEAFKANPRFQLWQTWFGQQDFIGEAGSYYHPRMKETRECWSFADCSLYLVQAEIRNAFGQAHFAPFILAAPQSCSMGDVALKLLPETFDGRFSSPALVRSIALRRVPADDTCVSPSPPPFTRIAGVVVLMLLLTPWLHQQAMRRGRASRRLSLAKPDVAVDFLRLTAAWCVVNIHLNNPCPFQWLCNWLNSDHTRLLDLFMVVTVRLMGLHKQTLASMSGKIFRKVTRQTLVALFCAQGAIFWVRIPSPIHCRFGVLRPGSSTDNPSFDEGFPLKAWLHWLLSVVTFTTQQQYWTWPLYPEDAWPVSGAWPTVSWMTLLEYTVFLALGALSWLNACSSRAASACIVLYFSWVCSAWMQAEACDASSMFSFKYSRLPSAVHLYCFDRVLVLLPGTFKGSKVMLSLTVASIVAAISIFRVIERHSIWSHLGLDSCRQCVPSVIAGLPLQITLLLFSHLQVSLPSPLEDRLHSLANLSYPLIVGHTWVKLFLTRYCPTWWEGWSQTAATLEGQLMYAPALLALTLAVAVAVQALVAEPWSELAGSVSMQHTTLIRILATGHVVLCFLVWPYDKEWYIFKLT